MPDLYKQVLSQAKIRDILSFYNISVNRNKFLCPFHDDSNPSMTIDDKKQTVKCFSCGAGGNAITFVQKYESKVNSHEISIDEAIKKVVEICNLNIDVSSIAKEVENQKYTINGKKYSTDEINLLNTSEYITDLWNYNLKTNLGHEPLKYLSNRGIDEGIIESQKIGYAISGQLLKMIDKRPEMSQDALYRLGLIGYDSNENVYEVFKDRVIFPICDEKGNIISFSGRSFKEGVKPKYLHTSETELFHKRQILYNYHTAKRNAFNHELILVEGYADVIGGVKIGALNTVGLLGVEITDEQIAMIKKCNCICNLALDADKAGQEATLKIIPRLLQEGIETNVISISKLGNGNYKDLGEASEENILLSDIEKVKENARSFLWKNGKDYFNGNNISINLIEKAYKSSLKNKIISTTKDEMEYVDFLIKLSNFSKSEINDIIHPKVIDTVSPIDNFKDKLLKDFVFSGVKEYLEKNKDKVLESFYDNNKEKISNAIYAHFLNDPVRYLNKENERINYTLLFSDVLAITDDYKKYEFLHRFQHQNVFERCFIRNKKAEGKLQLNDEQKKLVISQYDNTLSEAEKLKLEDVTELFIINNINDIDAVLPDITDPLLIETIKDRMSLSSSMQYFKYGSIFKNDMLPYTNDVFKNETNTNFKTILLFNNINGILNLKKENVINAQKFDKIADIERATVNDKTAITNSHSEIMEEHNSKELTHSEKQNDVPAFIPKSNINVGTKNSTDKFVISKNDITFDTGKGFFVHTQSKDTPIVFIPISLCSWNNNEKTHLTVNIKRKFLTNETTISKYALGNDGIKGEYIGKATVEDLQNVFHSIPSPKRVDNNSYMVSINRNIAKLDNNRVFYHIQANYKGKQGYIKINQANFDDAGTKILLHGKPNYTYSFYSNDNKFICKVGISELENILIKTVTEHKEVNHFSNLVLKGVRPAKSTSLDFHKIYKTGNSMRTFYTEQDELIFNDYMYEYPHEFFNNDTYIKLNGEFLYYPQGRSSEGRFEDAGEALKFVTDNLKGKLIIDMDNAKKLDIEQEVSK